MAGSVGGFNVLWRKMEEILKYLNTSLQSNQPLHMEANGSERKKILYVIIIS